MNLAIRRMTDAQILGRTRELLEGNRLYGPSDGRVTELAELRAEMVGRYERRNRTPVFYVYYRTARGGKGYREFKTRAGQTGFVARTEHAVTAFN